MLFVAQTTSTNMSWSTCDACLRSWRVDEFSFVVLASFLEFSSKICLLKSSKQQNYNTPLLGNKRAWMRSRLQHWRLVKCSERGVLSFRGDIFFPSSCIVCLQTLKIVTVLGIIIVIIIIRFKFWVCCGSQSCCYTYINKESDWSVELLTHPSLLGNKCVFVVFHRAAQRGGVQSTARWWVPHSLVTKWK